MDNRPQADQTWNELYGELRMGEPGHWDPLPRVCGSRDTCWADAADRQPPDNCASARIARPWVGPRYEQLGLLVVGINMNEAGGYGAMVHHVECAQKDLAKGTRRLRFGHPARGKNGYAGTLVFHRVGAYASYFAARAGLAPLECTPDGFPAATHVARSFDLIAMTNQVKCSPKNELSKPTEGMWRECGRMVLARELRVLRPRLVLVLGTENRDHLGANCFDSAVTSWKPSGKLLTEARATVDGRPVRIVAAPHPHRRGYDVLQALRDLDGALQSQAPV